MFDLFQRRRTFAPSYAPAICYSGYRAGQSPITGVFPSYDEVRQDLLILAEHWRYLRLYDCSRHAEIVLRVIRREKLPFKVMLGMGLMAEQSNPDCPWGADYPADVLKGNRAGNDAELLRMVRLSTKYRAQVLALSIGNEASVDWNDHMVPVPRLVEFAKLLRRKTHHPVTFCENYVPWADKLEPLVPHLDVISIHTYPVWEYKSIGEALTYTWENYDSVRVRYPDKPVIITEAGWTTRSNGRGINPDNASEALQAEYVQQLISWADKAQVLTFVFEAFDEPWKGSSDPDEPEKHWGLFTVDRRPKSAIARKFKHLL